MINLEYYKIFYEVAKLESVTKASEKLFISQPAISQTIKKLEDELGVKLFLRSKKGVNLTNIGKEIYEKVEAGLCNFLNVEKLVQEENQLLSGSLIIGSGSNISRKLLSDVLIEFSDLYPNVSISQFEHVQTKMFDMLKKGKCDLVVTQENPAVKDLNFYPLSKERYVFIKKKGSEVKRFIKISDGSFAQKLFNDFIKENNLKEYPCIKVSGYFMAIELALKGEGLTLVPEYIIKNLAISNQIEYIYEDYNLPTVVFGCYYLKDLLSPSANKFFELLKKRLII